MYVLRYCLGKRAEFGHSGFLLKETRLYSNRVSDYDRSGFAHACVDLFVHVELQVVQAAGILAA
jgi:hypothetical protein